MKLQWAYSTGGLGKLHIRQRNVPIKKAPAVLSRGGKLLLVGEGGGDVEVVPFAARSEGLMEAPRHGIEDF